MAQIQRTRLAEVDLLEIWTYIAENSFEAAEEVVRAIAQKCQDAQVEQDHRGKFLILDVNTGDYEIDPEDLTVSKRLLARRPDAVLFGVRIGHRAAYRLVGMKQANPARD